MGIKDLTVEEIMDELSEFVGTAEQRQPGDMTVHDIYTKIGCSRSHAYTIMRRAVDSGKYIYVTIYPKQDSLYSVMAIRCI